MHIQVMNELTPLAIWMSDKGVRDQWLAERLDRSQPQISRIRRGLSRPSPECAFSIEKLTRGKVKASDLLTRQRS
jgi:DNA-binding transcriptional regulator YdaS (Cro superfamily)